MNQRRLPVTYVLFVVLLLFCLVCLIPNRITDKFKVEPSQPPLQLHRTESNTAKNEEIKKLSPSETVNNKEIKKLSPSESVNNEEIKKLPPSVIDRVKTFVFFLGHPRSGHSIVGSLIDSHPHMVMASEASVFTKLSAGSVAPTKPAIFNMLWNNARKSLKNGLRVKSFKGYTLSVDGLFQGRYIDHVDVIGDLNADITTKLLRSKPDKWSLVYNILKSLNVTVKIILVIRNPYDNIACNSCFILSNEC